ncbi:MAG: 16S rRNA processing protein RimM [Ardenticatenaceae bacterium]|nr:16S rRNA processing protein RimM [Ardenticatenaceae bacterium]
MAKQQKHSQDFGQRGSDEPRFLVIGQVGKPHGVRGEVRVIPHTDVPERFAWLEQIFIGETDPQSVVVESARLHKSFVLLKLAGYDSREQVERLRGEWLQVLAEDAIPLEEGEYFLFQLVGLQVFRESGELLGELVEVIETAANNVFVIQMADQQLLLPDIEEVVREIDFANGRMTVYLLPGLLPENDV